MGNQGSDLNINGGHGRMPLLLFALITHDGSSRANSSINVVVFAVGHYSTVEEVLALNKGKLKSDYIFPHSTVIKDAFDSKEKKNHGLTSEGIDLLTKQTLLSTC